MGISSIIKKSKEQAKKEQERELRERQELERLKQQGVDLTKQVEPIDWRLDMVLEDLCLRAQVPLECLNFSALPDNQYVNGFSVNSSISCTEALSDLASVFLFDLVSFGGHINAIPRGGKPCMVINKNDMLASSKEALEFSRGDPISVPFKVTLEYHDVLGSTATNKQSSYRAYFLRNQSEKTLTTAVLLHSSEAARFARIVHKIILEEARGGISFKLPNNYIYLTPTDIVIFNGERFRIEKVELENGYQTYSAIFDRKEAYSSSASGNDIIVIAPPKVEPLGTANAYILDIPLINKKHDALGLYFVAIATSNNFAPVVVNYDNSQIATLNISAIGGEVLNTVNKYNINYLDKHNKIIVKLANPNTKLTSITFAELLNDNNLAYLGGELLQFMHAQQDQNDPSIWQLAGLVRGKYGSNVKQHASGDVFILLEAEKMQFVEFASDLIGQNLQFNLNNTLQELEFKGLSGFERPPRYVDIYQFEATKEDEKEAQQFLYVQISKTARLGLGSKGYHSNNLQGLQLTLNNQQVLINRKDNSAILDYEKGTLIIEIINPNSPNSEKIEAIIT